MTRICVSLAEETTAGVIARLSELAPAADMFEVRGDRVLDLDLLSILRARTRPLLFSCRPPAVGGAYEGGEDQRRLLLLEAVKRGYDYVDLEYESNFTEVALEKVGNGLVLSHHDFQGVPEDLEALYAAMTTWGPDVVKIAVTPRTLADVGRLLAFAREVNGGSDAPVIPIAMGPLGTITRVVGGRYGAPWTYASAEKGAETASGQVPAAELADLYRVRSLGPETRVYGLLGSDVQRSVSPVLHNRAFEARGVDAVYVPLQSETLEPFFEALPGLELSGFGVTRPFKVDILSRLDEVDEAAALAGSVNTVSVIEGRLQGTTTDGLGVLSALKRHLDVRGTTAVVLGAGGAARAAAAALLGKGARVTLLARDGGQAAFAADSLGCASGSLTDLAGIAWDVLINATPVGSHRLREETLVPAELLRPGSVVFDMVYDPTETRLLREARAAGCPIIGGMEMLLAQAAAQFETWTGLEAPLDVMKSAALFLAQREDE